MVAFLCAAEWHLPFGAFRAEIGFVVVAVVVATNGCVTTAICRAKLIKCPMHLTTTGPGPSVYLS